MLWVALVRGHTFVSLTPVADPWPRSFPPSIFVWFLLSGCFVLFVFVFVFAFVHVLVLCFFAQLAPVVLR